MLSGIFSAVRIWSERAVTTLLHLTLADSSTGCQRGTKQRQRVKCPSSPSYPVVGDPSVIRCRESFKTNGTIFATDRPTDWNGLGQGLPQQHFFRLKKNVAGGFTFAAETLQPQRYQIFLVLMVGGLYSHATSTTNVGHSMLSCR